MAAKLPVVYGFILRFGYVESSYASHLFLRHNGSGFDTLEEALDSLTFVITRDYIEPIKSAIERWDRYEAPKKKARSCPPDEPDMEGLFEHISSLPLIQASMGVQFDEPNDETWWPWDSVSNLMPYMSSFWEYSGSDDIQGVLPYFINVSSLEKAYPMFPDFAKEIREFQAEREHKASDVFTQVIKAKRKKKVTDNSW